MDECTLAELSDGRVYLNMRNDHIKNFPNGTSCDCTLLYILRHTHTCRRENALQSVLTMCAIPMAALFYSCSKGRGFATSEDGGATFGELLFVRYFVFLLFLIGNRIQTYLPPPSHLPSSLLTKYPAGVSSMAPRYCLRFCADVHKLQ